ncbi:hypothetical protein [Thalassospira sp. MCCC 1A01428]|uniref:hypothetical protein n=1 Tax=Thalassospira sp. MCCC 1A01428 TaxID=1470575 RepID=UPI000A1F2A95|nr:hypothetical protein [Thalassospira sp. MCCC 1A01428]OSQ45479.1 hypothetical protein THS27_03835 [Thalassospira sp. MCCC 1A01428]
MSAMAKGIDMMLGEMRDVTEIIAATALRYHPDGGERIYSTHPDRFPDAGFKRFEDAPTMARVRDANAAVLTNGAEALRAGFPDWQRILEGGCDAIINIPVRAPSGEVLGQLNLMARAGCFPTESLARLQVIADQNASCFLDQTSKEIL